MTADSARLWAAYLTTQARDAREGCAWACRKCNEGGIDRDPVTAIRAHLEREHGASTPTRVSGEPLPDTMHTRLTRDYTRLSLMGTGR